MNIAHRLHLFNLRDLTVLTKVARSGSLIIQTSYDSLSELSEGVDRLGHNQPTHDLMHIYQTMREGFYLKNNYIDVYWINGWDLNQLIGSSYRISDIFYIIPKKDLLNTYEFKCEIGDEYVQELDEFLGGFRN